MSSQQPVNTARGPMIRGTANRPRQNVAPCCHHESMANDVPDDDSDTHAGCRSERTQPEKAAVLLMLAACPPHGHAELRTLETTIRLQRGTFEPFAAFRTEHWRRAVETALTGLVRAGLVRYEGRDRYVLTGSGVQVARSVDVPYVQRQQVAGWMASAVSHQPKPRSLVQRAVHDMRRGRPPRWR